MNTDVIPVVNQVRDLGVIVNRDLRPVTHITAMVAKAHQRANTIHRAFVSRDTTLLVRDFLVYVRPLVEYNSIIYGHHSLSKTSKQSKVYKNDLLEDFLGLRSFHMQRDLND